MSPWGVAWRLGFESLLQSQLALTFVLAHPISNAPARARPLAEVGGAANTCGAVLDYAAVTANGDGNADPDTTA
eukprot:12784358-Alexandrium_andersonii.AAC.1